MSGQLRLSITGAVTTAVTALSLHTVFAGGGWLGPVLGAVVLVFATTSAARGARLPSFLHPVAAGGVVLLWITFLDARGVAVAGFIPGPGAFRQLGTVTRNGLNDVHRLATPVPSHRGIVLLGVVGVAAVSLVVDLLVVQFRRCALAGLPLLGLFTTCAAVGRHGAGIISYLLSAAAFLWLLFVDSQEQVTRWGTSVAAGNGPKRRRSVWTEIEPDPAHSATATALGRRIGGAAIGLGVVVPLLVPGLHTGIDRHTTGAGLGGTSDVVTFDPLVSVAGDLKASNIESVLSYHTTTSNPGYLRLTALDIFNGQTFQASELVSAPNSRVDGTVPGSTQPGPTTPSVTTNVTITPQLSLHWLPVDTEPTSVKVGGDWRFDPASATIFSSKDSTTGISYTTTSVPVDPTPEQLATAGRPGPAVAADLSVPQSVSPRVRQLAHQITKNTTSSYTAAVAIQDYLSKGHGFHYDTSVGADNGPDPLADFLFRSKRGFCQQFSASMAVLARIMGIPARVAVGFTRGSRLPDGSWLVTNRDAHAWPELWFQGVGWVPFEPTPRADGQAVRPSYAVLVHQKASGGGNNPSGGINKPANPNPGPTHTGPGNENRVTQSLAGTGHVTVATRKHKSSVPWLSLALLVIAIGLVVPGTIRLARRWVRRRRMRTPARAAGAAWAELRAAALDLNAPWDDMFPPRRAAEGVSSVLPRERTVRDALARVALAEERSRYARDPGPAQPELWSDVDRVATALRSRLQPMQRVRYRVFPRSVLIAVRPLAGRAADLLDGADTWIARSRRLLRLPPSARSADA